MIRDEAALLTETFRVHATFPSRGSAGVQIREGPGLTWVDSGLDTDTFNVVLGSRLAPAQVQPAVDEVLSHFGSVGRPFSWWVSPGDQPSDLEQRLASRGLVAQEWELAMACRTADIVESPRVPGVTIERLDDVPGLADFARINAENWTPPDVLVERYYERAAGALLSDDSPLRFYLARRDREAVAAVELARAGPAVGVYNLSTRRDYRGHGIGAALLTGSLLEAARETASTTFVLQAAPAAAGLYRRAGFIEVGRITEFKPIRSV